MKELHKVTTHGLVTEKSRFTPLKHMCAPYPSRMPPVRVPAPAARGFALPPGPLSAVNVAGIRMLVGS